MIKPDIDLSMNGSISLCIWWMIFFWSLWGSFASGMLSTGWLERYGGGICKSSGVNKMISEGFLIERYGNVVFFFSCPSEFDTEEVSNFTHEINLGEIIQFVFKC